MSKPSTPVRRSKVGPGRPGSAGGEIPLTASMEVLTPDPCVPLHLAASDVGRSQGTPTDMHVAPIFSKPRTPGSAALVRTRSTDGRPRSSLSTSHEVIPLNSTMSKDSTRNHIHVHPLALTPEAGGSPASSIVEGSGVGLLLQSPHPGASMPGGLTFTSMNSMNSSSLAALPASARARPLPDIAVSTTSSRFNPVTDDDDDMLPQRQQRQQSQAGAPVGKECTRNLQEVLMGASAVAVAQRVAAAAGGSSRRYAALESVAVSQQQPQTGEGGAEVAGQWDEGGSVGDPRRSQMQLEESVPGTPGSVASGRIGGVFFTDLHRSFGGAQVGDSQDLRGTRGLLEEEDVMEDGEEEDGELGSRTDRQGPISAMTSRLNPMQSPTMSEEGDDDDGDEANDSFAEYSGEPLRPAAESASDAGESAEVRRASTSAMNDFTNPVQTPCDSRLPTPLLPSTGAVAAAASEPATSLLLIIHDLYVTESESQPPSDFSSRPETAVTEEAGVPESPATTQLQSTRDGGEGGGDGGNTGDALEGLAASRAMVAALAAHSESQQSARRSELGEYMMALQELKDESGGPLVDLPADWGVMLERLFRKRRAEFSTLQGWMGPRRFEDLPINQLPLDHPDPRVEEGLARIRELDGVLNDKLITALIVYRETFPEQWAEQERKRLDHHSKAVEEALKRERQKRLRAARISRAVTSLDGPDALAAAASPSVQSSSRSLADKPQPLSVYSRFFTLKPEEEALVEAVLQRNDDEGAAINPFDLESAATYGSGPYASGGSGTVVAAAAGIDGDGLLADVDDIDLELDMLLPSAFACPTPTAAGPLLRPLSARLTEVNGGDRGGDSGSLRPLSTASFSSSSSRPGTSSGANSGMSPLTAAALHGHPTLMSVAAAARLHASTPSAGCGGGLLPERVYDDPRAAARALRAINARLAAFESEHLWDEGGGLADFKNVTLSQRQQQEGAGKQGAYQPSLEASVVPGPVRAGAGAAADVQSSPSGAHGGGGGGGGGNRAQSPPHIVPSLAGGPAFSVSTTATAAGHRDYLREERMTKELASRERDVDAALRRLKTGEVVRLGEATLKMLVEQCRRLQELNEHRRKIEEAEAAARKAQLQRQQYLASRASEPGSRRGTPKGSSTHSTSAASVSGSVSGTASGGRKGQAQPPLLVGTSPAMPGTAPTTPTEGGASASGRWARTPSAGSGSPGSGNGGGGGGGEAGVAGPAGPKRQTSAGKARISISSNLAASGQTSDCRRASDPANAASNPGGDGSADSVSTSVSTSSSSAVGNSRVAKTAVAPTLAASAASSSSAPTPKPRCAGRAAGSQSPLDGGGGLPPPPPPPPP